MICPAGAVADIKTRAHVVPDTSKEVKVPDSMNPKPPMIKPPSTAQRPVQYRTRPSRPKPLPIDVSAIDKEGESAHLLAEESLIPLEALCEIDDRPLHSIPEGELQLLMSGKHVESVRAEKYQSIPAS